MKLSIIVPVYNVKAFLPACLDSLVSQTLEDYEIILVDDGSSDGSADIIKDYQQRYPQLISSIRVDNGGQGRARNFGIDMAKGEYLGFVDSDDWITEDMYEKLYNTAKAENADIVIFQLEVPMETVVYAAKKAKEFGAKVLLNPAPAAPLSDELLSLTDILIPNEHEAEIITGIHEPEEAIKVLMQKCNQVIITLGEKGCIYNDGTEIKTSPAEKAKAVDTTAAGDSFIGAFCTALCEGKSLKDSIAFGAKVSAITVTRKGAAISIPTKEELLSL